MKLKVYAKKTCGTSKKAQAFLESKNVEFELLDILSAPPSREMLEEFIDANNVKASLNSRSAIYRERKLGASVPGKAEAIEMMLEDPNLIKRPFIIRGKVASFGFNKEEFKAKWL